MIFCNLGSGSKGNSTYIANETDAVLLDQGFSLKNLLWRMETAGLEPSQIRAVVLSHEHSDHLRGVGTFARRFRVPVYLTAKTYRKIDPKLLRNTEYVNFTSGDTLTIGKLRIKTFHIPHDAADPIGFIISDGQTRAGVATDIGTVSEYMLQHLTELDILFIEANHDLDMLVNGPYPLYLIQRIRSRVGHLSNLQTLDLLQRLPLNGRLQYLVLGHLSEINNKPEIVAQIFTETRAQLSPQLKIEIATQHVPGKIIEI